MATELEPKKVVLSQIVEDLYAGLTRWKKDDIGFGSLEKKYALTMQEMISLLAHPKIANIQTKIPAFIIVDDLGDEIPTTTITSPDVEVSSQPLVRETKMEVAPHQTTIEVKTVKEEKAYYETFI